MYSICDWKSKELNLNEGEYQMNGDEWILIIDTFTHSSLLKLVEHPST